ncbi:MAG: hypothetical protein WD844_12815 [Thermoleophilaceae bacterium]
MRHTALLLSATACMLLASGCSDSREDEIEGYVERANAIQEGATPELGRANEAYARFADGELPSERAPVDLAAAESSIRATRAELAEIEPPSDARTLHVHLLRFFDLSIELSHETTRLARYLPAAEAALQELAPASRRLARDLRSASGPAGQERGLARYRRPLERALSRLRRLEPPPVLVASHRAQVRRLRSLRSLAIRLGRAIRERDAREVARLLLRFRRRQGEAGQAPGLDARSRRAYQERHRTTEREAVAVRREQARIQHELRTEG